MREDLRIHFYQWTASAAGVSGTSAQITLPPTQSAIEQLLPEAMGQNEGDAMDLLRLAIADQLANDDQLRTLLDDHPATRESLEQFADGSGELHHHH